MMMIIGDQMLAAACSEAMARYGRVVLASGPERMATEAQLIVWCRDGQNWDADLQMQRLLRAQPVPWLPLWRRADEIWLGPCQRAEEPGCILCLRDRLRAASLHRDAFDSYDRLCAGDAALPLPPLVPIILGGLLAEEAGRIAAGWPGRTQGAALTVALATGAVHLHSLVPNPACAACGRLLPDSPERVFRPGRALLKQKPHSFRVAQALPDTAALRQRFVDFRMGIVPNMLRHPHDGWLPFSEAQVAMLQGGGRESGFGREYDYERADAVALLEALERYAGLHTLARKQVVTGSYREVAHQALDPASLILHSKDAYTSRRYSLVPYTPELPLRWVWAYSFLQNRPILVPEQAVYYGVLEETEGAARFLYETSNGCALGSSLEEAIFYGLLEIIERDAALLWWYAQSPVWRLDLSDIRVPAICDLLERAAQRGYRVDAIKVMTDIKVPAVMLLATRQDGAAPFATVAGGAHPDPLCALRGGLLEAVAAIPWMQATYNSHGERLSDLLEPANVQSIEDHQVRAMIPQASHRLMRLLATAPTQPFADAWNDASWVDQADFQVDLRQLVQRVHEAGMEVLAVDQTPPELQQVGLYAARVIVPGTLPLTFGHALRRVDEQGRVRSVPLKRGYGAPVRLNLEPHPLA